MPAEAAALTRSWRVGNRTVTLTVPPVTGNGIKAACMEWTPDVPNRLSAAEFRQYQAGRNAALMELAQHAGIRIALMDL